MLPQYAHEYTTEHLRVICPVHFGCVSDDLQPFAQTSYECCCMLISGCMTWCKVQVISMELEAAVKVVYENTGSPAKIKAARTVITDDYFKWDKRRLKVDYMAGLMKVRSPPNQQIYV